MWTLYSADEKYLLKISVGENCESRFCEDFRGGGLYLTHALINFNE